MPARTGSNFTRFAAALTYFDVACGTLQNVLV